MKLLKRPIKVLLTASGGPGWVSMYKCLKNNGERELKVYGCDVSEHTAGSYYAEKHFQVEMGSDPKFIPHLLKIAQKEHIDIILPTVDSELLPLAKNIELFKKNNVKVAVSNPQSLKIVTNKANLFKFLQDNNLPSPKYFKVKNWADFLKTLDSLNYPKEAVCFKPVNSYGSRGFRILDSKKNFYHLLLDEKPQGIYISFKELKNILEKQFPFPELLVMEYLSGKEYTVDIFVDKGEIKYIIPRLRLKMEQGITIEGLVEKNEEIISLSKRLISKLEMNYCVGIQARYDKKGTPKILEINPRLQGTTIISYGARVNLPYFAVKSCLDEKIPKVKINFGVHMYRHWQEVFLKGNTKYNKLIKI
ncbi:MAG: ATP-grasp domain-containing protein [bacterium]